MNEWAVLGLFVILFAPAIGRLTTIGGIITVCVGVGIMALLSGNLCASFGLSGLVCVASGYTYHKVTGEPEIVDGLMLVVGIVCLILAFVVV